MKSFEEWYKKVYNDKPTSYERGEEKAYQAGAEEKEKEMLEFADWLSWHETESIPQSFAHWKKEVKTKKEL